MAIATPPGIPVNLSSTYALGRVSAKWLAPDASGDRPFLGFLVQVRPQNAEGAAWTDIGTVPWHAALDYRLTAKVPANPAIPAWDVRVCSTTTLTASCSPAQTPTGAELVTTEMLAFEWLGDAEHPRFKDVLALVK